MNTTILHMYTRLKNCLITDEPFLSHFECYLIMRNVILSRNLQLNITTIGLPFLLLFVDFLVSYLSFAGNCTRLLPEITACHLSRKLI